METITFVQLAETALIILAVFGGITLIIVAMDDQIRDISKKIK